MREILLNTIQHKIYESNNPIQICIYEDKKTINNIGKIPETITKNNLYQKHSSIQYNPKIARVLFNASYIENWGIGFVNIKKYCTPEKAPLPKLEQQGEMVFIECKAKEKYLELLKNFNSKNKNYISIDTQVHTQVYENKIDENDVLEFCKEEKSASEICEHFGFKDSKSFRRNYIVPLIKSNKLEMTIPNKPTSSKQKYISIFIHK